jgi:hypothetical protein
MNSWQKLVSQLDLVFGFPNKLNSRLRKLRQGFDSKTNEYVFLLEYRIRVIPGAENADQGNPPSKNVNEGRIRLISALDW